MEDYKDRFDKIMDGADDILQSRTVKIIMVAGASLVMVYVAGYVFHILTGTVVSFKKLHKAIKS